MNINCILDLHLEAVTHTCRLISGNLFEAHSSKMNKKNLYKLPTGNKNNTLDQSVVNSGVKFNLLSDYNTWKI